MGWPAAAANFREEREIPFPLIVDQKKETYRALEMKRGNLWEVAGPHVWLRFTKSILSGHGVQAKPKEDPLQMGGVVVADKGGRIGYRYLSSSSSDNPPTDEVIAAIP
jgi:peroxiredoxin